MPVWYDKLKTGPTSEPVSQAELEAQVRIAANSDTTTLVFMGKIARAAVENHLQRALMPQTWQYWRQCWPRGDRFELTRGRLRTVTHVKWKDTAGTSTTLTVGTDYLVDTNPEPGQIVLPHNESWPSQSLYPASPIEVEFTAGYADATDVPLVIRQVILMLAGTLYDHRESLLIGTNAGGLAAAMAAAQVPTYDWMLNQYRVHSVAELEGW